MNGYQGFSRGLATGFGLTDAYLSRKDARDRSIRLDKENTRRWDTQNKRQASLADAGMQVKQRQLQEYDLNQAADIYSGIVLNPDGTPIDVSKLSPEQMAQKKGQLQQVINRTKPFRDILTQNSDVDPENPLADISFVMDKKTGEPSAVFSLRTKDGRVAPLTENRSSDPNDGVVVMPLSELNNNMMAVLGSRGTLGASRKAGIEVSKERRAHNLELALEDVKFGHQKELQGMKAEGAANVARIKEGGAVTGGGLTGNRLKTQQDASSKVLKNELGTFDDFGNFAVNADKVGGELSLYGMGELLSSHYLNTGEATDGREAATRAITALKQVQANGGGITYDRGRKQWVMFDGSRSEDGKPNYVVLHGDSSTAQATRTPTRKRTTEPPTEAVRRLEADPSPATKKQFDDIFGEGAADKALGRGRPGKKTSGLSLTIPPPKTKPLIAKGSQLTDEQRKRLSGSSLSLSAAER